MSPSEDSHDETAPAECRPCRGTGAVISGLGGEQRTMPCPWCGGTGVRTPGLDAQTGTTGAPAAPAAD